MFILPVNGVISNNILDKMYILLRYISNFNETLRMHYFHCQYCSKTFTNCIELKSFQRTKNTETSIILLPTTHE